jgi:hypothetical protein
MSKMGSHCSFGHLKHKLWPKEGPGVELPGVCQFWLPTTKRRKSTRNTCLQTTCDIPLESSRRELQLCFKPHFDPRSARKVMGLQSPESPIGRDFASRSSNTPLYPSKCCELGSASRLLFLPLSFTWIHIWVLQGVGSVSHAAYLKNLKNLKL